LLNDQTYFAQVPLKIVMKMAAVKLEHEKQVAVPKAVRRKVGTGKRTKRGPVKERTLLSK
jgi:hypothetical protein